MCGFLGAFNQNIPINYFSDSLKKGLVSIRHRGPDSSDEVFFENAYLGHNRLSIIDLSNNANQPFYSNDKKIWLVFNGEIYNYKELKKQLGKVNFRTTSDTEVLLEGYISEGVNFFKKLKGIYAFAILDFRNELPKIILFRDPSGIKPLYYYYCNGFLLFGSEIKALLPSLFNKLTPNEAVIKSYLNLSYCLEPCTVYKEIFALEPGYIISLTSGVFQKYPHIKFDFNKQNQNNFEENITKTQELLQNAISRNLVSDVGVSVALSGGIDSSLVYAISNDFQSNIQGISVRFNDSDYDESEVAASYAKQLNGKLNITTVFEDFNLDKLDKILLHFDQPYADTSAIPVYYLTRASAKYSKVLLGGDGGDELYNGYASQVRLALLNNIKNFPLINYTLKYSLSLLESISRNDKKREFQRIKYLVNDTPDEMIYDINSWFPRYTKYNNENVFKFNKIDGLEVHNEVFSDQKPEDFYKNITFAYFRKQLLSDYLRKTEMMSMLNSVEYRVPLLDEDLISFALSIPFNQKASLKESKKILRTIHSKYYKTNGNKAPKKGFSIPLDRYLKKEEFKYICDEISKSNSIVNNFIDNSYIKFLFDVINGKLNGRNTISRGAVYQRIIILYALHIWNENRPS